MPEGSVFRDGRGAASRASIGFANTVSNVSAAWRANQASPPEAPRSATIRAACRA